MCRHFFIFCFLITAVACGKSSHQNAQKTLTQEESNLISDMYESVSKLVDSIYEKKELRKERIKKMNHKIDSCHQDFSNFHSFGEMQSYFVLKHFEDKPAQLQYISSIYNIPSEINNMFPTSLVSHELCPITRESLVASIGEQRVPDADTIKKLNIFSNISNNLRKEYLESPSYEAKLALSQHWLKLSSCLSYMESYSTADSAKSRRVAHQYGPESYQKPDGVGFYYDPAQPQHSKLNVGTYQFTPNVQGNIKACVKQWNVLYPSCAVSENTGSDEMIRILGSELQTFNIFCGIDKITQTFAIQVNSTNLTRTHMANRVGNRLKESKDRCVSLNFYASYAYNHFGPFQNSTGSNLKELMACYFR